MVMTDFRAVFLPYCLERQKDGRYVVLNRRYKPLGFMTSDWVDYGKQPIAAKLRLPKNLIAKLSCNTPADPAKFWLYNDDSIPTRSAANMRAYQAKIALLAKLKIQFD